MYTLTQGVPSLHHTSCNLPVLLVLSMEDPVPLTQAATTASTQSWILHILVLTQFFVEIALTS